MENLQGIEAYFLNMYTVPEYRGKGFARRLLELCINESKKMALNEFGCTPLKMENIYIRTWVLPRRIAKWSYFFNLFSCFSTGAFL